MDINKIIPKFNSGQMDFYWITEIPEGVSQESKLSPDWTFVDGKIKELLLSPGFFAMKDLITMLMLKEKAYVPSKEDVYVGYVYTEQRLKPFIAVPHGTKLNNTFEKEFDISNITLKLGKFPNIFKDNENTRRLDLMGSLHPLKMHKKYKNVIDELIEVSKEAPFLLFLKFSPLKEWEQLKGEVTKLLKDLRKEMEKTKSKSLILWGSSQYAGEAGANVLYKELLDYYSNINRDLIAEATTTILAPRETLRLVYYKLVEKSSGLLYTISSVDESPGEPLKKFLKYRDIQSLASLMAFPNIEWPGIRFRKIVHFGKNPSKANHKSQITIGKLKVPWNSKIKVQLPAKEFTRHAFVTGITGGGKTTTVKTILAQLSNNNIPFMVVEPVKSEYRNIGNLNVKVYEIGAPFDELKMNPFAFPKNIHIQTHLDLLKSVFNAAFPMYGPMPYILETALIRAYTSKGWDLYTGENLYAYHIPWGELFPTLRDLYEIIDKVTAGIGYSHELTTDIRAALKVRIGSLMTGAKGNLLNTREMLNLPELLKDNVVLELEHIGDEGEKIFMMGLILIMIYEYYIAQKQYVDNLKHVIVFEEAHRLLQNIPRIENPEIGDIKGKAIETFTNIISEMRAYSEGIIVVEQIPSKITPDVIKNTNIKIIHRLLAEDERKIVGDSIGLDEEQISYIINLKQGEAIVFSEYLDKAMNVSIEALPASSGEKLSYEGSKTISVNLKFKAISQVVNFKRAEIFRDLNTLLLFPSLSTEFLNQLKNFYENNLNGDNRLADIRFEDIQHEIVLELINIYLEDCLSKDFLLDLPTYHKIKVKMKSSPEPLKELFTFINDVISTQRFHHPMISFAPKASRVKFLLSRSHELREYLRRKIKQILFQISPSIPQFYPLLFEELRNILSSYFNIDIMSENLRKEFIDALMLSLFGSNELDIQILEYYFNVKEITPQINVSNPRNNEINFEKSEEEYSTTGSLNDNIHTHFDKVNQDSQTLNKGIEVNLENVMSKINSNIKLMTILMGINGLALILIIIAFLLK